MYNPILKPHKFLEYHNNLVNPNLLDETWWLDWNWSEGSVSDGVICPTFSKAVILNPHPLKMKIHRDKLKVLFIFIRTFSKVGSCSK